MNPSQTTPQRDYRKAMSDNVAYALLIYTGLQIFVTVQALHDDSGSMLPMLALVVMVGGFIPVCRHFEKHWEKLSDAAAIDPALRPRFRKDRLALWLLAIGLPFLFTALFTAVIHAV